MSPHHQHQIKLITHCMVLANFVTRIAIALAFRLERAKLWKLVLNSRFANRFPVAGASLCCVASSIVVAGVA